MFSLFELFPSYRIYAPRSTIVSVKSRSVFSNVVEQDSNNVEIYYYILTVKFNYNVKLSHSLNFERIKHSYSIFSPSEYLFVVDIYLII